MNAFVKNFLKGTNFKVKNEKPEYTISYGKSYVRIYENRYHVYIYEGETNNKGKGTGTTLRALATLYAITRKKPIYHTGINLGNRSKTRAGGANLPTSTWIVRERLGWTAKNKTNSVFKVGNNNTKIKNWLKAQGFPNPSRIGSPSKR